MVAAAVATTWHRLENVVVGMPPADKPGRRRVGLPVAALDLSATSLHIAVLYLQTASNILFY
jgi:hypothetical protein